MASRSLRCVLIGSDSLLVECGEILLREGQKITHVVTDTPRIADWARERGLSAVDPSSDYVATLRSEPFECLFSITWLSILPEEVLELASECAINFHDGPLPAYAGLYTPAWAILNRERDYGVTWHRMTAGVDEGDILEHELFEISGDETSLTINTRCFEAGLTSFERLVEALAEGRVQGTPQDRSKRSYFGKFDRPDAACMLNWQQSAEELEAFIRALDFGRYPNPLGTPKLGFGGEVFCVAAARVSGRQSDATPGSVISVTSDAVAVATGSGVLELTRFAHSCGAPLTIDEFVRRTSVEPGSELDVLDSGARDALSTLNRDLARGEAFWTRRLQQLEPLELPWSVPQAVRERRARVSTAVPIHESFADREGDCDFADALTAALGAYLARVGGKDFFHVGLRDISLTHSVRDHGALIARSVPMCFEFTKDDSFKDALGNTRVELDRIRRRRTWLCDAVGRTPGLSSQFVHGPGLPVEIVQCENLADFDLEESGAFTLVISSKDRSLALVHEEGTLSPETIGAIQRQITVFITGIVESRSPLFELSLLDAEERERVLVGWNRTAVEYPREACVQDLFDDQAALTPKAVAAAFGADEITYAELSDRASRLAAHLIELGVRKNQMVGVHVERSIDLIVAVFGVLKAGAAYLPLDPAFPSDRVAFMVEDSGAPILITQKAIASELPECDARLVEIDGDRAAIEAHAPLANRADCDSSDLAYAIYTSGSTGKPKGVLVEHRNVANFFAGMDERIGDSESKTWLAVTSLSFDISVLELLWTTCRGYKTVVFAGVRRSNAPVDPLQFGLSFFASNAGEEASTQYDLLFDAARFADQNGFRSIWTPERHFHAFGGLYPNPSVTSAALAAITKNLELRAGSVVVALHDPIRIAEEWSLVDNLSKGRVGISIAAGWHPNDFVLAPERYEDRKDLMIENTKIVRKLWHGEAVSFPGPKGDVETRIMPRPVQPELPIWVTAAGNPDTFRQAGELGANVLTHLLGQSTEELTEKIRIYREAWDEAGHRGRGTVTIMLHTFIGEDVDEVREIVRGPMREYLRSAVDLIKNHVSSWSAVKKSVEGGDAPEIGSLDELDPEDVEALLDYSFERYFETSALFGTPESCLDIVTSLHEIGVDEITSLVDFGVPSRQVLESLPLLGELRQRANAALSSGAATHTDESIADLIERHGVTHLQCTPSMATMLVEDDMTRDALAKLEVMMVGGEALPLELARRLESVVSGRVLNMYGPTETTIWSSVAAIDAPVDGVTIGTPIANTQLYVLDGNRQPVPSGVFGELYIAGDGVTRGYHDRPELTAERFVPNPFSEGERMYRTGDVARWLPNGEVEFVGRVDHQVKVRGYRIELGEIESVLAGHPRIDRAVVVARTKEGADVRLAAYCIANTEEPQSDALVEHLSEALPEYMVPSEFHFVSAYPLTPNKKIDRNALAALESTSSAVPPIQRIRPVEGARPASASTPPSDGGSAVELGTAVETIQRIWCNVLGVESVGPDENFFDLGGHSLLTIRVQKALREDLGVSVPLVDMFRFTTVRSLAQKVASGPETKPAAQGQSRAAMRAAKRRRRAS